MDKESAIYPEAKKIKGSASNTATSEVSSI